MKRRTKRRWVVQIRVSNFWVDIAYLLCAQRRRALTWARQLNGPYPWRVDEMPMK